MFLSKAKSRLPNENVACCNAFIEEIRTPQKRQRDKCDYDAKTSFGNAKKFIERKRRKVENSFTERKLPSQMRKA